MKKTIHYILTIILLMSFSIIQAQYLKFIKDPTLSKNPISQEKTAISEEAANAQMRVDINKVDADTLAELKGIGPKKSKSIVNYRKQHGPFKSVGDLAKVPGIGKKSLARILKKNPDRLMVSH